MKLKWNSDAGNYQASEDGHLIEVDGDVFAEARTDLIKELVAENGLSEEEAYQQADDELSKTVTWTGSLPMHGVSIDGVPQE